MWGVGWFPTPTRSKSGYQLGVLHLNSILTYLHRDSIRLCRSQTTVHPSPPSQDARCKPGCYLCFWPTGHKLQVPTISPNSGCQVQVQAVTCTSDWLGYSPEILTTAFLGLINLPEWLTELREKFLYIGWLVYYYKKNSQMEETHRARHGERAQR